MAELPGVGLITGGASGMWQLQQAQFNSGLLISCIGIGQATALAFAQAGCRRMTLADVNGEGLESTKSLILKSHPDAEINLEFGNTTVQSFTEHMVSSTVSLYGRLDYAVNCAGVLGPPALSHEIDLDEHDRVMTVNYRGTFLSSRAELRAMIRNEPLTSDDVHSQRGAIVNIASTWGLVGARGFGEYLIQALLSY